MPTVINGSSGVNNVENGVVTADDLASPAVGTAAPQKMMLTASQATTSGTSIDFLSIPSWAKKITVMFNGVSTNGTANYLIQLGSGSVVGTGYTSAATLVSVGSTNSTTYTTSTLGMVMITGTASAVAQGTMQLTLCSGSTWIGTHLLYIGFSGSGVSQGTGTLLVGGVLDRVRLIASNGTDTFDAGSVSLLIEGY